MDDKNKNQAIKTPLYVILDMAKTDIGSYVLSCMQANNIPAGLMMTVVKEILLDLSMAKTEQLSGEFLEQQKILEEMRNMDECN